MPTLHHRLLLLVTTSSSRPCVITTTTTYGADRAAPLLVQGPTSGVARVWAAELAAARDRYRLRGLHRACRVVIPRVPSLSLIVLQPRATLRELPDEELLEGYVDAVRSRSPAAPASPSACTSPFDSPLTAPLCSSLLLYLCSFLSSFAVFGKRWMPGFQSTIDGSIFGPRNCATRRRSGQRLAGTMDR